LIGVILAGGENRRIPVLKGFLGIEGRAIIERSIEVLSKVIGRVVISTNMPEKYFSLGVPLIGDTRKDKGPIIGILSVLAATQEDSIFVVACDMPFISEKLIRSMVASFESQKSGPAQADALIPVFEGKKEPLFGIYAKNVIEPIEGMVPTGEKRLIAMLDKVKVRYFADEEVRAVDPEGKSFVNINTMEDYQRIGGMTCLV
jgi:molybdopterin-guanine dinucleotide biosynthesis protein A